MISDRTASRIVKIAVAAILAIAVTAFPARAEPPLNVPGDVTDHAGALGGRVGEVQSALKKLSSDTSLQLFVVYVRSFDGVSGQDWATKSAELSGLGANDILLAVATDDRRYGVSVADGQPLSDEQLSDVETNLIEPKLRDGDWAGAAIQAADGYRTATGGGSGIGTSWVLPALLVIGAAVIVTALLVARRRRRGAGSAGAAPTAPEAMTLEDLNTNASRGLVMVDDAIKTSTQELGFAQAQFGVEATKVFNDVLEKAKATLTRAFALRHQLDDSEPDSPEQRRAMLTEIITLCAAADTSLDEQVDAFDELRDLYARVPQVLQETAARAKEAEARLEPAQASLEQLKEVYREAALASVATNPAQAKRLLSGAQDSVAQGQAALTKDDRGKAVAAARAAEDAVGQAVTLLDSVDRAGPELAGANASLDAAIASISGDLADAARLAPTDATIGPAVAEARDAVAAAQKARSDGDPLAALRRLAEAEKVLDGALGPLRDKAAQDDRARGQLTELTGRVRSRVQAVQDFIETRRGAVGAEARTRLSEASRLLDQAAQTAATSPASALADAQQAEQLAESAQRLAEADVSQWETAQRAQQQPAAGGGMFGGGNANSMVLGGILLDTILRGGGIFGGGGGGGGGGGIQIPGSFGGSATRGRRGGGGRF